MQSHCMVVPNRRIVEDTFVAEVRRINTLPIVGNSPDVLAVLRLQHGSLDQASKEFRRLMLILHPDKRTPNGEVRAGGKEACDRAFLRGLPQAVELMSELRGMRQGSDMPRYKSMNLELMLNQMEKHRNILRRRWNDGHCIANEEA